jgi:hypothetical protein
VLSSNGPAGPAIVIQSYAGSGSEKIMAASFNTFSDSQAAASTGMIPFTETVFIRSGSQEGHASFDFLLTGSISASAAYLGVIPTGATSHRLHLNHYYFDITVDPFHTPAEPRPLGGWLTFDVKVHPNPEPSSLLLAGIGLPALGMVLRRRRRKAAAA